MKLIKICKKPLIEEDTDRWGRGLGTYSVNYAVGIISEDMWNDVFLFENYGNTDVGKQELEDIKNYLSAGGNIQDIGNKNNTLNPEQIRLIGRAGGTIWQMNLRIDQPIAEDGTTSYVRVIAFFNNPSLYVHDKSFDEEYERLKLQVIEMNKKQVGNE
jgi:hypothetical protein